jgi:hypothetical protein
MTIPVGAAKPVTKEYSIWTTIVTYIDLDHETEVAIQMSYQITGFH